MTRSTYLFPTERDYEDAISHLERSMRDDADNSNKLWFRGSWGSCYDFDWPECWRICIEDECSDPELAASICREHRGRYYRE
ncbi:MAG: hypothetical protein K1W01_04000 [Muribaculaceae bacterium]